MKTAKKNTFYIRVGGDRNITLKNFVENMRVFTNYMKIEILYLDSNPQNTYYYILKYKDYTNYGDYNYGYNSNDVQEPGFEVWRMDPVEFFKPVAIPHSWDYYGPDMNNDYNVFSGKLIEFVPRSRIRRYLRAIPYLKVVYERQEKARVTGRAKLEDLRMKAVESAVGQFETKTGRTIPQNVQNLIEQSIKPIDYRYYQGRDNLKRINTSLFQNE
jgi:hypothetical protein